MEQTYPVAIFTYNRLDTLRQTVDCLLHNTLAPQTSIYVFSDGPKADSRSQSTVAAVRFYLEQLRTSQSGKGFHEVNLIFRPQNIYLERNITEGLAQLLTDHEAAIVIEDDICTGPYYLQYMNDALHFYRDNSKVMHVAGFTNLNIPEKGDVYFTPHMSGWGWGTWADRWQQHFRHYASRAEAVEGLTPDDLSRIEYGGRFRCLQSLDRTPIPWDICWEMAIYRNHGLCLTPTQTLVRNCGIGGGTHFHSQRLFGHYGYDRPYATRRFNVQSDHIAPDPDIEERLNPAALTDHGFIYNPLGRVLRRIKHIFVPKK
jgi:hypothetical protein